MNRPKIILDSKGLVMHMYYRGVDDNQITCKTGKKINTAGWGFINWLDEYLLGITKDFAMSDIIAVWDGGSEYREALYPDYKRVRKEAKAKLPAEERQQLTILETAVKGFLANLGVINVYADGVEADDVIATVCRGYKDCMKVVHTLDADLLQLSDEKTVVFLKGMPITDGKYKEVPLNLLRLNKALVGDKSDGYGGVYRFGEKAWEKLVKDFGFDGLEEIDQCFLTEDFTAMKECNDKNLNYVLSRINEAKMCYELATLQPDICYQFRGRKLVWPQYYVRIPSRENVMSLLNSMGCPEYIEKFEDYFPTYQLLLPEYEKLIREHFSERLEETPFFSFDYETVDTLKHPAFNEAMSAQSRAKGDYLDVLSSEITGASFNYGKDLQHTVYIPTLHADTENYPVSEISNFLREAQSTGKPIVAHNCGFEEQVTKLRLDPEVRLNKPYDTMIMSSYVNENELSGLKFLSSHYLNYKQMGYKELLNMAGAQDMSELSGREAVQYGCDDSMVTASLFRLFELILRMEGTWEFYQRNERAPVHVLNHAFEVGVNIDYEEVKNLHAFADDLIEKGMKKVREILKKHCKKPDPEAAKALEKADGNNISEIIRYASKEKISDTAMLAKKQERILKWEEAAVYTPYEEIRTLPDFRGTVTQLNIVAGEVGAGELKMKSIATSRINEFVNAAKELEEPSEELKTFLDLLGPAAGKPLKNREGGEFEALKSFCLPYLGEGKVEKLGDELNFNSPVQMEQLLYCKLALPVRKRTKVQRGSRRSDLGLKGSPSADEDAMLMAISEDCEEHPWKKEVLETIISVKSEMTKISLYYRGYPLWKHPRDGMIHPGIKNCGTVTRRPSGTNPNVLQVEKGKTRSVYLPRFNDHVIVALDFSGQELRITGSESQDPVLIDAYTGGGTHTDEDGMVHPVMKDIHSVTALSFAETVFQRELSSSEFEFTYDAFREWLFCDDPKLSSAANLVRKMAKVVNFLIIYGGQPSTLAMNLKIKETFAEEIMRNVFRAYQRLAPWQEETTIFGRLNGYVRTAYGTIKHLGEDMRSRDGGLKSRQERQAINQTIQGCAADILKVVLTDTHEKDLWHSTKSVMIAPVYDEIVSSVPVKNVYEYCVRLQDMMNVTPPGHAIPMVAEVSIGPNWYAAGKNELGDNPSERKVAECIDSFRGVNS